jgi:hypothetical protein
VGFGRSYVFVENSTFIFPNKTCVVSLGPLRWL